MQVKNLLFNTEPQILHFNGKGRNRPDYKTALDNINKLKKHPDLLYKCEIITACNGGCRNVLKECCDAREIPLTVLGKDIKKWSNSKKLKIFYNYVVTISDVDFIICLDAADTLIIGDLNIVINKFINEAECDVWFNGEKNSWPKSKRTDKFEDSVGKPPFHRLNSGVFIGKPSSIEEIYAEAIKHSWKDDQHAMRNMHEMFYPKVKVDCECKVFQSMRIVTDDEVILEKD